MTAKKIGIWLDHDQAYLTEFTIDPMKTTTITSALTHEGRAFKGESHMHSKEQHKQTEYYKKLGEHIRQYNEVVLFGPTSARNELMNALRDNHLFNSIKISVQAADKMTEDQMHTFVRNYFSRH